MKRTKCMSIFNKSNKLPSKIHLKHHGKGDNVRKYQNHRENTHKHCYQKSHYAMPGNKITKSQHDKSNI